MLCALFAIMVPGSREISGVAGHNRNGSTQIPLKRQSSDEVQHASIVLVLLTRHAQSIARRVSHAIGNAKIQGTFSITP